MENRLDISRSALGKSFRHSDVTFYRNGRIDISSRVSRILGLQPGDVIDIAVSRGEFYLYVRAKGKELRGRYEAQCFQSNKGEHRNNFRAYSKKITNLVLNVSGSDKARIVAGQVLDFENVGKAIIIIPSYNLSDKGYE